MLCFCKGSQFIFVLSLFGCRKHKQKQQEAGKHHQQLTFHQHKQAFNLQLPQALNQQLEVSNLLEQTKELQQLRHLEEAQLGAGAGAEEHLVVVTCSTSQQVETSKEVPDACYFGYVEKTL